MGGGHRVDDLFELFHNFGRKISFDFIHLPKFGKGPPPIDTEIVDAGNPVGFHSVLFIFGILAAVAFDLDDQV